MWKMWGRCGKSGGKWGNLGDKTENVEKVASVGSLLRMDLESPEATEAWVVAECEGVKSDAAAAAATSSGMAPGAVPKRLAGQGEHVLRM